MFKVCYKFLNDNKEYIKEFNSFLDASRFQGDLLRKYKYSKKNPLEFAIYLY